MSSSATFSLVGLLQWVGPILGFVWALRTGKSRVQIVLASAVGGMLGGLAFGIPLVQMAVRMREGLLDVPSALFQAVISTTIMGVCIGLTGLAMRAIAASLNRRT